MLLPFTHIRKREKGPAMLDHRLSEWYGQYYIHYRAHLLSVEFIVEGVECCLVEDVLVVRVIAV